MTSSETEFKQNYQTHLKYIKLKGLQPKTIEAYSGAMRRMGVYFNEQINDLSESQLTDYFSDLLESHSWSSVKLDLYGLKFFYAYVLNKPWTEKLIKPPRRMSSLTISSRKCLRSVEAFSAGATNALLTA
ncbi:MAG TPA: site-specific integrase [Methylobacter sp.]|jgi:site-specific recombinase XerD